MANIELLKKLCLGSGISGNEQEIAKIMREEVSNFDELKTDKIGSVAFYQKCLSNKPKILLVAHLDEIGFVIADITSDGLIKLQPVGGWNSQTLLSSQLKVITKNRKEYTGTIGCVPKHYQDKSKKPTIVQIKDMFFDIGACSRKDVEDYGISLGDPVVPDVNFIYFEKSNRVMCKAFDDRVGVCAVVDTLNYFSQKSHPNTLIGAGSVQEEVGTRGANTLSELVKPDLAIIIEGAPADDLPGLKENPQSKVGEGAHLRLWDPTMIVHNSYKKFILETAKDAGVKFQPAIRKTGGTDARVIHLSDIGVPSIVVGVPVRYAHSHRGIISLDDYDELQKLLRAVISKLDEKKYEEITKPNY